MFLHQLLEGVELLTNGAPDSLEIAAVCCNSEQVSRNSAFVCLRGSHFDGHDFIARALQNGASVIVADALFNDGGIESLIQRSDSFLIRTVNTRKAMAYMCSNLSCNPAAKMRLIAVTGTNGKTTTTYMLRAILAEAGFNAAIIGTTTGSMTTPDPEQLYPRLKTLADSGTEYVAMEASSHALALDKLAPIIFDAGIFTNLTPEHLDFHGTMEDYFQAKSKLFEQCRIGLFNLDGGYGKRMYDSALCDKWLFSAARTGEADFTAMNVVNRGTGGLEYNLHTANSMFRVSTPMTGAFNISNSLGAASAALIMGIPPQAIRSALRKLRGVPGRVERVPCRRSDIAVFIDYAHTPDALENLLRSMREIMSPKQRLTVLFGCGGDRDRSKRRVMGAIATRLADLTIVTGDNSRSEKTSDIIADILKGIDREKPYKVIENRKEAIIWTIREARADDVIILAGKGHENYEITADGIRPFSETEIVAQA